MRPVLTLLFVALLGACAQQPADTSVKASDGGYRVPPEAESRFHEALLALEDGQWQQSALAMESLWQDYPFLSGPALNAALIYSRQDQPELAEQWFEHALQSNPANIEARNEYAVLLRSQGRYLEAEQQYRAALEAAPESAASHYNLGILCDLYLGRKEQALEHFARYQQLSGEEDRRVAGWMADLQRQLRAGGSS